MKTFQANKEEADRKWLVIDLKDKVLGRAATQIADLLRGKHKPTFTPHADAGDFVVVVNAEKVKLTGNKLLAKEYNFHSGYIGGLKTFTAEEMLKRRPTDLITLAVKGMLPKNQLSLSLIKKLKVYVGESHPHSAQAPQSYELKNLR